MPPRWIAPLGLIVAACGSDASVAEPSTQGGGAGSPTSTSSAVATVGVGGGGASATSGGAGGVGGGSVPSERVVTVLAYDGTPEAGVDVVAQDASGAVVDHQLTGSDGTATVLVVNEGMVTVGYEHVVVLPGDDPIAERRLVTFAEIGQEPSLTHRLSRPRQRIRNASMTLEFSVSVPSQQNLFFAQSCPAYAESFGVVPANGTTAVDTRGCEGESSFDVTVLAVDVGRKTFSSLPFQVGSTVSLVVSEVDLQAPPVDHLFDAPQTLDLYALALGLDTSGNLRFVTPDYIGVPNQPGPFFMTAPPAAGVERWIVREDTFTSGLFTGRRRSLAAIPATSYYAPTHLAQASQLSVSVESVERPQLFWSFAGARPQGDVVELTWWTPFYEPSMVPKIWRISLPPGTTSFALPELPAALEGYLPIDDQAGIAVMNGEALIPDAGRKELFAFEWEDIAITSGDSLWYP
jgi:hypothetical protein